MDALRIYPLFGSPELESGTTGVWYWNGADLSAVGFMTDEEHARVNRLVDASRRTQMVQYLTARRHLLAIALGVDDAAVSISHDVAGVPFLPERPDLRVSFSACGERGVVALHANAATGVDVEIVRDIQWMPMLSMIATPEEREWIQETVARESDLHPFLRLWTCKEAVLKAVGTGLRGGAMRARIPQMLLQGETQIGIAAFEEQTFDLSIDTPEPDVIVALASRR